jgi:hypothetical protein
MVAGVLMPWVDGRGAHSGWGGGLRGDIWGSLSVVCALGLLLAVRQRSRSASQELSWWRWAPAVLGVLTVVLARNAQASAQSPLNSYGPPDPSNSMLSGSVVAIVGALVCAVGGIATSVTWFGDQNQTRSANAADQSEEGRVARALPARRQATVRAPAPIRDGQYPPPPGRAFAAELVVGAIVSLLCGGLGAFVALRVAPVAFASAMPAVLGALIGLLLGAVGTDLLWRQFISRG